MLAFIIVAAACCLQYAFGMTLASNSNRHSAIRASPATLSEQVGCRVFSAFHNSPSFETFCKEIKSPLHFSGPPPIFDGGDIPATSSVTVNNPSLSTATHPTLYGQPPAGGSRLYLNHSHPPSRSTAVSTSAYPWVSEPTVVDTTLATTTRPSRSFNQGAAPSAHSKAPTVGNVPGIEYGGSNSSSNNKHPPEHGDPKSYNFTTTTVSYVSTGWPITSTVTYTDATTTTTVCSPLPTKSAIGEPHSDFISAAQPTDRPHWGPWNPYTYYPAGAGPAEPAVSTASPHSHDGRPAGAAVADRHVGDGKPYKRASLGSFINEHDEACEIIRTIVPRVVGKREVVEQRSVNRNEKRCTNGICDTGVYCVDARHVSEAPASWGWERKELSDDYVCVDDTVYEADFVEENCECAGLW